VRRYLVIAGTWILYECLRTQSMSCSIPSGMAHWMLAGALASAIAAISGVLGIAGGEMRIPVLWYLFGTPLVEAGTLTLIVSIPTVSSGAVKTDGWAASPVARCPWP
jgi:hypothetical protein